MTSQGAGERSSGNGDAIRDLLDCIDPDVVLVDYFDTLVTRRVHRRAVKRIASRHLLEHFDLDIGLDTLVEHRRAAEREVADRSVAAGFDGQYRIEEVAGAMWDRLTVGRVDIKEERSIFCDAMTAIESSVELASQVVDTEVVGALEEAARNRSVVVVSDFHFREPMFREMLVRHGIAHLFDAVIVSCEPRLSKRSGRLYPFVLQQLDTLSQHPVMPERVVMIGDDEVSDVRRAEAAGIVAHQIRRIAQPDVEDRRVAGWSGRRRRVQRIASVVDEAENDFAEMAVTLFAFVRRLHRDARNREVTQLAFQAREGQYLRCLFDLYQRSHPAAAAARIETSYLVVSRRSTHLAALRSVEAEDFSTLTSNYDDLSLAGLLGSLGFEPDLIDEVADSLRADPATPVDVELLRADLLFRRLYTERRSEQQRLLTRYVNQTVGADTGPVVIVDVGWKGTIQDHLQQALGEQRPVHGLYLGIVARRELVDGDRKRGLLFDTREAQTVAARQLRHFKALYEYLLQADHGSAARYICCGGRVEPELDDQAVEAEQYDRLIAPVQAAIAQTFEQLCRLDALDEQPLCDDLSTVARFHSRMLFFPSRSELDRILALRFYGNFGRMGYSAPVELEMSRSERAKGVVALVARPWRILGLGWPPLYLAQLGLRQLVPVVGSIRVVRERWLPSIVAAGAAVGRRISGVLGRP